MPRTAWLAAALLAAATLAHADDKKPLTEQQNRMAACNRDAGDMKGDERRAFMSQCLSGKAKMTPQQRMSHCNREAGERKGDERRRYMSDCLKQ